MVEPRMLNDEGQVVSLYQNVLDCWNRRAADEFGARFAENGNLVGFDGSQVDGRSEVTSHLRQIFANHRTPTFVEKVREVRFLAPDVAILRAIVGMIQPGHSDINPALNAIQTLVAAKHDGTWQVEMLQNTPAAFHGRPELSERLTEELRNVLRDS